MTIGVQRRYIYIYAYMYIYIYIYIRQLCKSELTMINNISGTLQIAKNPGITGCNIDFIH